MVVGKGTREISRCTFDFSFPNGEIEVQIPLEINTLVADVRQVITWRLVKLNSGRNVQLKIKRGVRRQYKVLPTKEALQFPRKLFSLLNFFFLECTLSTRDSPELHLNFAGISEFVIMLHITNRHSCVFHSVCSLLETFFFWSLTTKNFYVTYRACICANS